MVSAEQRTHWINMGIRMGYPLCCIRAFVDTPLNAERGWVNPWAGTGFIACPDCSEKPMFTVMGYINNHRHKSLPKFPAVSV